MYVLPFIAILSSFSAAPSAVDAPSVSQTVVAGRPALIVSWTKPLSELAITGYDVQYKRSSTTGWSTVPVMGSDTLSTTLKRLSVGTSYDVQVRAVSVVGNGQYSGVVRKTTYRGLCLCVKSVLWVVRTYVQFSIFHNGLSSSYVHTVRVQTFTDVRFSQFLQFLFLPIPL